MTTGRDLDSYTIRSTGRPWHETEFLHILLFLHFADNSQRPHKGKEYDRLWILRTVFDKLNEAYAKFYNPSEHLAVDNVTVKFQGKVIFRLYEGRLITNAHSEISTKRDHVFEQMKVGSKAQYFRYKLTYLFFDIVSLSFNTFFPT